MEQWCNDSDRGKLKYREKNMETLPIAYHQYHMDWPGIEPGPPQRKASS
jgi:hypothetical protein